MPILPRAGLERRAAVALAAGAVLVLILVAVGPVPAWSGALHLVALSPLDVLADARWLLTRSTSWPVYLAGTSLLLALRVTALAAVLGGARTPAWRRAIGFYAVAFPVALVAATFDFIAHAVMYSRVYAASLVVAGLGAIGLGAVAWQRAPTLRRSFAVAARSAFRVDVLVPYLVVVVALGALAEWLGPWAIGLGVVAVAVATHVAIRGLLHPPLVRPAIAGGAVVALVAGVTGVTLLTRGEAHTVSGETRPGSLVVMSGINSSSGEGTIFRLEPWLLGFGCERITYFSYAGTGDGQPRGVATCPKTTGAPYEPEDTQRPFAEQVQLLTEQVADLDPPVLVLAHSQAAWVAWQAAVDGGLPSGSAIVLIGPFPSSPVGYPPPGERGAGRVAGDLLRLLEPVPDLVGFDFIVDAPLSRELLAEPDAASGVFARPLPADVDALSVTASTDVALMPDGWRIDGAADVCPVREAHPYLPVAPRVYDEIDRFLAGEPPRPCPPWAELYRLLTQPLGVPSVEPDRES